MFLSLTFAAFFLVNGQVMQRGRDVQGPGLDLNPSLLGCIAGGGECFTNTGFPFLDKIFSGRDDYKMTPEQMKDYYLSDSYWSHTGESECSNAKMDFWISKQSWPDQNTMAQPLRRYQVDQAIYFSKHNSHGGNSICDEHRCDIFTCNPKQHEAFIDSKIRSVGMEPPDRNALAKTIAALKAKYNSPEAVAQREREERKREEELRNMKFNFNMQGPF